MNDFQLKLFKGDGFLEIENMQKNFLDYKSAKASIKHSKVILLKHGVTHYEIVEHHESFKSKGRFQINQ